MANREYLTINGAEHYRDWSTGNDCAVDRPVDDAIRATQHYQDAHKEPAPVAESAPDVPTPDERVDEPEAPKSREPRHSPKAAKRGRK